MPCVAQILCQDIVPCMEFVLSLGAFETHGLFSSTEEGTENLTFKNVVA